MRSQTGLWLWNRGAIVQSAIIRQPEVRIMNAVYVPKLRIYVTACIDMQFRIYDRNLKLMQTTPHEEISITFSHYLPSHDMLILGTGSGLSTWTVDRRCVPTLIITLISTLTLMLTLILTRTRTLTLTLTLP